MNNKCHRYILRLIFAPQLLSANDFGTAGRMIRAIADADNERGSSQPTSTIFPAQTSPTTDVKPYATFQRNGLPDTQPQGSLDSLRLNGFFSIPAMLRQFGARLQPTRARASCSTLLGQTLKGMPQRRCMATIQVEGIPKVRHCDLPYFTGG